MNGYIGKVRINIVNNCGVLLDNYIWIVTTYGNTLLRFNLETKTLEYVVTFKDIQTTVHSFKNIVAYGRCLYLIPGYADHIVKYNIDTHETMYIKMKQDIKERVYSRVCVYKNQIYIFVAKSKKIYLYDLLTDKVRCSVVPLLEGVDYAYIKLTGEKAYFYNSKAENELQVCLDDLSVVINRERENNCGDMLLGKYADDYLQSGIGDGRLEKKVFLAQKSNSKTYLFFCNSKEYGVIEDNKVMLHEFPEEYYELNGNIEKASYDFVLENGAARYLLPRYGNVIIQIGEDELSFFTIKIDKSVIKYFETMYESDNILSENTVETIGLNTFLHLLTINETKETKEAKGCDIGSRIYSKA